MMDNSDPSLANFSASMSPAYRALHNEAQQRIHAGIVSRRGTSFVHAECFDGPDSSSALQWLCLVTDDRPGLLSQIASVVLAHSLDIVSARAYSRVRSGNPTEAIDFILVRSLKFTDDPAFVDPHSIASSLQALLNGETDVEHLASQAAPTSPPRSDKSQHETKIYFAPESEDLLIVESEDRRGLLLAMTLAMLREGLTIQNSNVTTTGKAVRDEFVLAEFDGSGLTPERRDAITRRLWDVLRS